MPKGVRTRGSKNAWKGGGKNKFAPRRPPAALEQDRGEMMAMLRRGYTQDQIAEKLGVSRSQIHYDMKIVLRDIAAKRDKDTEALVATKMQEYAEVKVQAWEAWERSKANKVRTTVDSAPKRGDDAAPPPPPTGKKGRPPKSIPPGANSPESLTDRMETIGMSQTSEGQFGDSRYLSIILQALAAERELLGINPAKEMKIDGTVGWDAVMGALPPPGEPVPDVVEEEIRQALTDGRVIDG